MAFLRWLPSADYDLINSSILMCEHTNPSGKTPLNFQMVLHICIPFLYSQRPAAAPRLIITRLRTWLCGAAEPLRMGTACSSFALSDTWSPAGEQADEQGRWESPPGRAPGEEKVFITLQRHHITQRLSFSLRKDNTQPNYMLACLHGRVWK